MSFERGFPIPKHGNWSPVTRGMPVPRDNATSWSQESTTPTTTGRNGDTTEKTLSQRNGFVQRASPWKPATPGSSGPHRNGIGQRRSPWTPVTPEKLPKGRSNAIRVGKKEKQSETSDNWQDLDGVYNGLLKEGPVDTKKRNLCSRPDKNKGAESSFETQNCGVHLSDLRVDRNFRKRSISSTSTLRSKQTQKFCFISDGQTSKDGATSSTITESLPFAPITPAKQNHNQLVQENVKSPTNQDSPPSAVSTTQKEPIVPDEENEQSIDMSTAPQHKTPTKWVPDEKDEHRIDMSTTPQQKMPTKWVPNEKDEHGIEMSKTPQQKTPTKWVPDERDEQPIDMSMTPQQKTPTEWAPDEKDEQGVDMSKTPQQKTPTKWVLDEKDEQGVDMSKTPQQKTPKEWVWVPDEKDEHGTDMSKTPQQITPNEWVPDEKDKHGVETLQQKTPIELVPDEKDEQDIDMSKTPQQKTSIEWVPDEKDEQGVDMSKTPQQKTLKEWVWVPDEKDEHGIDMSKTPQQKIPTEWVPDEKREQGIDISNAPQQKTPIERVPDEKDEHGIDMSKTPQQKMPTRRRKHRPRVIKPQKPKRDKKDATTPGEPRVKRKYVRRKGVNASDTQPKTPVASVGKRKYVRKKNIDQVKGQQKSTVDDPPVKSCKKKLNFDLDINLNANPQDNTEQERKINGNKHTPLPNVPIAKTTDHALYMLARNMNMSPQENKPNNNINNTVPPNHQKVQQPNLPSVTLDETRGIKRQMLAMDSLFLYQKLLLGVARRSHNHNVFLENHKKRKIQSGYFTENPIQMNGAYNGSAMQLLHSSGQKVNPANFVNCQYQTQPHIVTSMPQGIQFSNQGHGIGWNQPAIPPNEGIKYGVITYPAASVQKKKRVEKDEVSVDDIIYKLERLRISKKKKGEKGLVLYKGSDAVVPFEPTKKRSQRPKVDLDPDSDRLWKLIMGKEGSEGGETLDKDKEKWWENERKVFRGRADSFIARMHLVQGDRRFSRWKGSVVDSVIGVFLTQNVSDHLSSSAFMALAAKYPLKTSCEDGGCERPIEVTHEKDDTKCDENMKEPAAEDSFESTTTQIAEETRSSSGSNSEAEDLTTGQGGQKQESVILEGTAINIEANSKEQNASQEPPSGAGAGANTSREKKRIAEDERNIAMNWDSLRKEAVSNGVKKEKSKDARDSLDYEAFRHAPVNEISDAIKERGMNNLLADRMQNFLNRLVRDHGKIDLEWLRDVPPEKAKDYLLSFRGLGLKSVECIRLLTLHHLAFPVDTNVGRIAVRLGWVPLQPLPESLQLHLLEMYPVLDSIQKYLWPRLCKLDQLTLYELHYQMITFGKVFCTKSKPNCNACPMRAECRHFASAFASARLSLPGPEEKKIVPSNAPPIQTDTIPPPVVITPMPLPLPQPEGENKSEGGYFGKNCEPIIEEPTTPEPEATAELSLSDIEDQYYEDSDEIPSIKLNMEEFTNNLQSIIQDNNNKDLQDDMSKSLVALTPNAARIPTPRLKDVSRLRTEHQVYELPDSHRLLEGLEKREPDDPSPYLLAIWTPGETANSIQPPERECPAQESGGLCDKTTCFSCNCIKEANSQVVRGTILIPCRTATRGSFPLNGTYFQVNEMFADHESSLKPIDVPRSWIWNLPRRTVYFGTSVSTIFRGLSTQGIQYCFWKGFVCVRGFDRKTRAPRPLMARLHFPASKLIKLRNEGK